MGTSWGKARASRNMGMRHAACIDRRVPAPHCARMPRLCCVSERPRLPRAMRRPTSREVSVTTRTPTDATRLPDRRRFLKRAAAGAALAATPAWTFARSKPALGLEDLSARRALTGTEDESFWEMVKGQFPLRPGLILVNAANLCPSPWPVQETVFGYTRDIDQDASFHNGPSQRRCREVGRVTGRTAGASPEEMCHRTRREQQRGDQRLSWGRNEVVPGQTTPENVVGTSGRPLRLQRDRVTTPPAPETEDDCRRLRERLHGPHRCGGEPELDSRRRTPGAPLCEIAREHGSYAHGRGPELRRGGGRPARHGLRFIHGQRPQVVLRAEGSRRPLRPRRPGRRTVAQRRGRGLGRRDRRGRGRQVRHLRAAGRRGEVAGWAETSSSTRRSGGGDRGRMRALGPD